MRTLSEKYEKTGQKIRQLERRYEVLDKHPASGTKEEQEEIANQLQKLELSLEVALDNSGVTLQD